MTTRPSKPWSMEEDAVSTMTEAPVVMDDAPVSTAPCGDSPLAASAQSKSLLSPANLTLAAAALAVAAAAAQAAFQFQFAWLPVLIVAGVNIAAFIILRTNPSRPSTTPGDHNTQNDPHRSANPDDSDSIQPIWNAAEQQTRDIQVRLDSVVSDHEQMSLELSLATAQKRQLSNVLDALIHPLLVVDAFGQLFYANPAAATLFQFDRAAVSRKPLADFITDKKLLTLLQQAREADARAGRRRVELDINDHGYALNITPYSAEAESSRHGIVADLRDITRDREAARNKSEFVAHAAHELRTPLSAIRGYVEMLVDGEAADEKTRAEYYEIIQASADRLGRMINNILDISRIEAGTVRVNKEPVAVSMIVKEAADTMRLQAEKKKINLTEELAPVVDRILADKDLIQQAILNLLSNAIKYTPDGGSVHVRMVACDDGRRMKIEVSDSGAGIPREDLPKMFEKFFRVEANKSLAAGTGLGLNLVKQIVEAVHGGEISVTSEVGKGSSFAITLPLYEP
ncbi:MAG: PAS domain-containing protein [Planctomycetes bacterium]|nr:PAS domain-containing protein [Planctomycetota bacterium]